MRARWIIVGVAGCGVTAAEPSLRIDPAAIDLDVGLDERPRVDVRVFATTAGGETDVTAAAQLRLIDGAPLGAVAGASFTSDGRTGGRATIAASFQQLAAELPVHVRLHSTRRDASAPPDAVGWFGSVTSVRVDATLEPGDGAVLPPNLGRFDVDFAAADSDDVHEVALTGPDLDLRVLAGGVAGPRHIELTAAEWDAVSRTSAGGTVQLAVRSLRSAAPAEARTATAELAISDLPFAGEVLFTGAVRQPIGEPPQLWSYGLAAATTERWAIGPGGTCIGCHVAISRDGHRLAVGDTNFDGVIMNVATRYFLSTPGPAVGIWNAATFDPGGALVTAFTGTLTLRDGTTALPIKTLATELPASQPAISPDGHALAYVAGPIDPATTQPINQELSVHTWDAATGTLGPARVLVPRHDSDWVKLPDFSSDGRWIAFSRAVGASLPATGLAAIRSDGSGTPLELTHDRDDCARFASPITVARSGASGPEPMTWIVMKSYRAVGPRSQDLRAQLWAMAFYPDRGAGSRPFHLPGQRPDVGVLHAPIPIAAPAP